MVSSSMDGASNIINRWICGNTDIRILFNKFLSSIYENFLRLQRQNQQLKTEIQ